MPVPPTLATRRLLLRPFTLDDAPAVQAYVSDREVAWPTAAIPHPYPAGGAEAWIRGSARLMAEGTALVLAMTERESGALVGAVELRITPGHRRAEMGYWVGRPHWGRGFATEAASALVRYALGPLGLHRVHAGHLSSNPASGAVLRNAGMRHEGRLRAHAWRWGALHDLELYGIVAGDLPSAGPDESTRTAGERR